MEVDESVESLGVRNFLAARIQEINSLSNQISTSGIPASKGLAFQHVPKHMRRRAVSHNPKRLPKRLQGIHRHQVEKSSGSSVIKKTKKPSRRHRRRPSNLTEEYNRRQREHKWLETHIWHAKRFHILNKWGYRIPQEPTAKGYRAGYRAASQFCAMRDISYYACFELEGNFQLISSTISTSFASTEANPLSLSSEMYKTGKKEGTFHFYRSRSYPFGYVGRVRFYWKMDRSSLFLWVHPAQKEEILNEICAEFELMSKQNLVFGGPEKNKDESMDTASDETEISEEIPTNYDEANIDRKLLPKKLCHRPKWINYSTNVMLTDLEGVFNRFRLYGPLATQTLKEVFQVLSPAKLEKDTADNENINKQFWWLNYYQDKRDVLTKQCELWEQLKSFSQVPCHSVIPLTLNDPRISIPSKTEPVLKKKAKPVVESFDDVGLLLDQLQSEAVDYPILNEKTRTKAIDEKMSQEEFNKRQSQLLIPGSKLNLGVEENQVPIILIHRPNTASTRFKNGGWDIILPAGWAMPVWIAFVYRSVRVLGLRESETFESETGSSVHSNEDGFLPPDSLSGETDGDGRLRDLKINYFKYPPAKRPNFVKLGCPFPFKIDWRSLLKFGCAKNTIDIDSFYVMRNPHFLEALRNTFSSRNKNATFNQDLSNSESVLIEICLTIVGKGSIGPGAIVCIPHETDIVQMNNKQLGETTANLEEPAGDDTSGHKKREELRNARDRMKSFMQKKRKKLRKKSCNGQPVDLTPFSSDKLQVINGAINSLWLPDSEQVLKNMSTTPIGAIVFGRETYSIAKCSGIGYCTFNGLKEWFNACAKCDWNPKKLILVRDCRNSLVYRFAKLEICI